MEMQPNIEFPEVTGFFLSTCLVPSIAMSKLIALVILAVAIRAHVPGLKPPQEGKGLPKQCERRTFLDTFPFFLSSPLRYRQQEMALLVQFARFSNKRASLMLKVRINPFYM